MPVSLRVNPLKRVRLTPCIADFVKGGPTLPGNSLIFSNKAPADVICEPELRHYLGSRCFPTCTRQRGHWFDSRRVGEGYLREAVQNFDHYFYICGPDAFVSGTIKALRNLGAKRESLVLEKQSKGRLYHQCNYAVWARVTTSDQRNTSSIAPYKNAEIALSEPVFNPASSVTLCAV